MSLFDFLQGASNAAASNVSGPVDLIGAGLRFVGVPVPENALLSSKWMEEKGLTKKPKNALAGMLGEAAGLSAPIAAAAKAPQIAAGLLSTADDFQKYNKALGPAGASQATVWHGSPHQFDKFDAGKIGTGEGAQVYGHGLYLAEAPEVAQTYRRTAQSSPDRLYSIAKENGVSDAAADSLARYFHEARSRASIDDALTILKTPHPSPTVAKFRSEILKEEPAMRKAWGKFNDPGSLYKVDLPDEMIGKMLDWDAPLSRQAPGVQQALQKFGSIGDAKEIEKQALAAGMSQSQAREYAISQAYEPSGAALHGALGDRRRASEYLRSQGVPGIRYLDGGSRGTGSGTSNFVVFPGEENALRILERNGNPLLMP